MSTINSAHPTNPVSANPTSSVPPQSGDTSAVIAELEQLQAQLTQDLSDGASQSQINQDLEKISACLNQNFNTITDDDSDGSAWEDIITVTNLVAEVVSGAAPGDNQSNEETINNTLGQIISSLQN